LDTEKTISVVYIAYIPMGFELFERFINSYTGHTAGIEHQLIIVFKGANGDLSKLAQFRYLLNDKKIEFQEYIFEKGLDIDTYMYVAKQVTTAFFFFLNSSSIILANDWLKKFHQKISEVNVAVIASTASYQSYYSTVFSNNTFKWQQELGFSHNYKKYKLFIKTIFYWRFLFKPFPNPHFRTNAFLIKRELFLKINYRPVINKFTAYLFESGRNSIYCQLKQQGYKILLIDKFGKSFEYSDWPKTNTFWMNQQENLIFADNQTLLFTNSTPAEKKKLTRLAWGTHE